MSASVIGFRDRPKTRKPAPARFRKPVPEIGAQPVFNERTCSGTLSGGATERTETSSTHGAEGDTRGRMPSPIGPL
jgi:hypothetical protein